MLPRFCAALLGVVCLSTSAAEPAGLADLLLRKGLISEEEYRTLPPATPAADQALGRLLVRKGMITEGELAALGPQTTTPSPATSVTVNNEEGFKFKAADGATFQAGVLAQLDWVMPHDDRADLSRGTDFRRLRPNLSGTFLRDWSFRTSYELSDGGSVVDAYVAYGGFAPVAIIAGNFVQPYSFESLASDKYNSFMERALPFVFSVSRAPGVSVTTGATHWSAAGAVFGEPLSVADSGDEGWGTAARFTFAPVNSPGRLVHFGLSLMERWPTQDNGANGDTTLRFRPRPESDGISQRFIDTGEIAGDVQHYLAIDPELAAEWGAFSLQGEYMDIRVARRDGPKLGFSGWYVQAAWTLTGEPRPYKTERGTFDAMRPKRPMGPDGPGMWELALRLSEVDLGDEEIDGGRERNATVGINFYPNSMLRATANWVKVLDVDGGSFAHDTPSIWQMRLQLGY